MEFKSAQRFLPIVICLYVAIHVVQGYSEVVYPERIHTKRSKRDLSTALMDREHEEFLTVKIDSKQEDELILELKKNDPIHHGSILIRTIGEDGKPVYKRHVPDDCMYSGKIRGKPNSNAFISTCNGLTGSMDTGETQYDIESARDGNNGHNFYNVDDELEKITKEHSKNDYLPNDMEEETVPVNSKRAAPEGTRRGAKGVRHFNLVNVEEQYIKYLTTNDTRYAEMFISVDNNVYQRFYKDTEVVLERVLNLLGQVDQAYQAINVRLVLVALDIQNDGRNDGSSPSKSRGARLYYFRKYWHGIRKEEPFKYIRMDNAQLLTHYLKGVNGMAYLGAMCAKNSVGVVRWYLSGISGPRRTLSHEFGHNINFHHGGRGCKCLSSRGCIMWSRSSRPGFTDCNLKRFARKKYACMNNYPVNPLSSACGNGIREKGEECDCGTPENCAKYDPCCEPHDCKLKAEAQCTFLNNPHCCNIACQFQKQGTLCREASNNCDVPEYCTGNDSTCPIDRTMMDGTHCGESVKMLTGERSKALKHWDKKTTMKTTLTPPVIARYFKVIPKHWGKKRYACMRLYMLGCNPSKDSSLLATPISSLNEYYGVACLTPDITSCDKPIADGTKVIYKRMPNNDCYHPHMLFTHAADGTLTHTCSGKKVCPRGNRKYLMISSKCASNESTYVRTAKWSLKQKKSGLCVSSQRWWPKNGHTAKLLNRCDKRLGVKLIFQKTDCLLPLGFRNGKLPDSAFSAGSTKNTYWAIPNMRFNKRGWCPATRADGSWIQIDFGKLVEVRKIVIAGKKYNTVTGYNLHYSDNGVLWHKYKESSAASWKDMNSYCYNGECAPTYDHQCRQLWSGGANKSSDGCWIELNMNATGYGSCAATRNTSCTKSNVFCGQLQCTSRDNKPRRINYGTAYKDFTVDGKKCSGAMITNSEEVGLGMVKDGTMCGGLHEGKFCVGRKCRTLTGHGVIPCGGSNGTVCSGKGICTTDSKCHCNSGYNPDDNCATLISIVDGNWNEWSSWTACTKVCNTGKRRRHRFCNNPTPKYGGTDCLGARVVVEECNKKAC